jgi:hypothetical protein
VPGEKKDKLHVDKSHEKGEINTDTRHRGRLIARSNDGGDFGSGLQKMDSMRHVEIVGRENMTKGHKKSIGGLHKQGKAQTFDQSSYDWSCTC